MTFKMLFAVAFTVFVGQTIKLFLHRHQYRRFNSWVYLEDGGMPSCHGVALASLCTALLFETGLSVLSSTTLILSVLFLGETMKVSRRPGIQSELMARFVDVRDVIRRKLTEGITHTPEQVFVGVVLGIAVTSLIYAF